MSRLGKYPIEIPNNVEVTQDGTTITVRGPKGKLTRMFRDDVVSIEKTDEGMMVEPKTDSKFAHSMWGTTASHIRNMIAGVQEPFEKKLSVEGVGYRAELSGNTLTLHVGLSHQIDVVIPEGIDVSVEKNEITISGIDKEAVGSLAARIRAYKKPEPYKGKGIRYVGETVRMKEGKKSA